MSATTALLRNEIRLLGRTPAVVIWTVLLPLAALVVMMAIPGARESLPLLDGLSVVEAYQPTLIVFVSTLLALQMMPMFLGSYRESGFLRRLRATPAHPANLLTAIVLLVLAITLAVGLLILSLPLIVGVGDPVRLTVAALVLVPCAITFLALGAFLAAVIPNPRVASGVGAALAAVMWFFAGMWYPRAQFPDWLTTVADWTPGGAAATALTHTAHGLEVGWQPFVCLAVWTVAGLLVAVRTFRWE
ncbi:MAG TPA: ABC transporter permease [Brevibacterium sp.]|nr:ABC transporter permease [Brevibacterium sp.]